MHTPIGRYRWLRMPLGVSLGPEEYQRRQHEALVGLAGVVNKADDILVFGSGDSIEEAEKDHDINLCNLMLRCRVNLKLNPKKFQFKVKQVTWMGHLLSSTGITPHPDRVQAIKGMTPPQDVKGVQRFLGMCNYLSRFTPNFAEIVKPLTELTHGNEVWSWSSQHDKAFKTAKSLIANATTLKFFDVNKPCVLQVDASDTGLGGALLQDGQPVAFTSSTLSAAEVNYAPIEKEFLAIKVAGTKFYQYLYGKQDVVVHSDHQPLETIFKKPLSKAPRRLQRMMLQLQPLKFSVVYKKGKCMYLADTLSRAALNLPTPSDPQEEVFQCISEDAPEMFRVELETMALDSPNMYPSTLEEIKAETEADPTLSVLCGFVAHGWPSDKSQVPTAFSNFAKTYGFKLTTRSPYYARATGKAEAAVKEVKKMLKKSDLLTGLLDYRSTPPQGITYSPAQRFLCRRTKSNLPISESFLSQSVPPITVVRDEHLGRRAKAKAHYDKTASRDLSSLAPGQFAYTRPTDQHRGEQWKHGQVLREVTPRSYVVQTQDGLVRRNRIHLRPSDCEPQVPCDQQPLQEQPVMQKP